MHLLKTYEEKKQTKQKLLVSYIYGRSQYLCLTSTVPLVLTVKQGNGVKGKEKKKNRIRPLFTRRSKSPTKTHSQSGIFTEVGVRRVTVTRSMGQWKPTTGLPNSRPVSVWKLLRRTGLIVWFLSRSQILYGAATPDRGTGDTTREDVGHDTRG